MAGRSSSKFRMEPRALPVTLCRSISLVFSSVGGGSIESRGSAHMLSRPTSTSAGRSGSCMGQGSGCSGSSSPPMSCGVGGSARKGVDAAAAAWLYRFPVSSSFLVMKSMISSVLAPPTLATVCWRSALERHTAWPS